MKHKRLKPNVQSFLEMLEVGLFIILGSITKVYGIPGVIEILFLVALLFGNAYLISAYGRDARDYEVGGEHNV